MMNVHQGPLKRLVSHNNTESVNTSPDYSLRGGSLGVNNKRHREIHFLLQFTVCNHVFLCVSTPVMRFIDVYVFKNIDYSK